MSSYPAIRDLSAEDSRTTLQALVQGFNRDAAGSRKLMRDLLDNDRQSFYSSAIEVLKTQDDSPAFQYLATLLATSDLLLPALCDRALSREQAVALARAALQADSMAGVTLAKRLSESAVSGGSPIHMADAPRLLEILGEVSGGARLLPEIRRLLRHSNPYLRSKAVLMVGRDSPCVKWVQERLSEPDPRVRANAIEALWGVDTEEARGLLRFAMYDKHNRVQGNALIGLYWLGDCSVIPDVLKMAGHESSLSRATAAWVMGETGDPRFTEVLAGMLREPGIAVRKRAFAALGRIKAAAAQTCEGSKWRVAARFLRNNEHKCPRRLRVAVFSEDGRERLNILPTEFILSEDGRHAAAYDVIERRVPEGMSVVFVLPRMSGPPRASWSQAALKCLAWKRPSDLWCAVPYLPGSDPDAQHPPWSDLPPLFSSRPEVLKVAFGRPPHRADCVDLWKALWRSVRPDQRPAGGTRHLIVLSPAAAGGSAGNGLITAVLTSRTSVQAISLVPDPALEEFCRRVRGSFRTAAGNEEIPARIEQAYLNLLAGYVISYQPVSPDARTLRIRVQTPAGWGETNIAIPAPK